MAKLEFGLREGLAVDMEWDQRINDLRYQTAQKAQAKIQGEAKAKMFADDFEFNNAMNSHDNPLVKTYAQNKIREIGKFVNENPDWQSNVTKRGLYTQLTRELKDNPDLNRGLQSDENWKAAQKDMADTKNADLDFTPIKEQWKNYITYGNQMGAESAVSEGKKPFVYNAPQTDIDVVADALKTGKDLGTTDMATSGGFGAKKTFVEDKKINDVALAKFEGPQRRSYENAWKKLSDEQRSFYGNDKYHWAQELVRAGTDVKFDKGQYIYPDKAKGGSGGDSSAYSLYARLNDIPKNKTTAIPQEYLKSISPIVKDSSGKGVLTTADVLRYKVDDGTGKYIYRTLSAYKGKAIPAYETGNYMNDYNGRAMVETMVTLPMTPELTNKQNGLFTDAAMWGTDYVPREGMENQVKPIKDKDGNWYAQMPIWVPARLNQNTGQEFDNTALGQGASNKAHPERERSELISKNAGMINAYKAQGYAAGFDTETNEFVFTKNGKEIRK